jgi:hypothetical protein
MMGKRAQAGLEYLVTYGWALVLVSALIGTLVIVLNNPEGNNGFSSSDAAKVLVRGSSLSGNTQTIKLQNITGGEMKLTYLGSPGFENCSLNNVPWVEGSEMAIGQGAEITLVCNIVPASAEEAIFLEYTDFAKLLHEVILRRAGVRPASANRCGNGQVDPWEACDASASPSGVPAGNFACNASCSRVLITSCDTLVNAPGLYYIGQELGPPSPQGETSDYCVIVLADDVTIEGIGAGPHINLADRSNDAGVIGVGIWAGSTGCAVKNLKITGNGISQAGIYILGQAVVSGNDTTGVVGTGVIGDPFCGINFAQSAGGSVASGNSCGTCSTSVSGYCEGGCSDEYGPCDIII